jgi:hypothetical protein
MKKILVAGNSYLSGFGFKQGPTDSRLMVAQMCNKLFDSPEINNLAVTGSHARTIFQTTALELSQRHYDIVFVGWSLSPHFAFDLGLELYSTYTILSEYDININPNIRISGKKLKKIGDELKKYMNDHWSLLDIVKYVNTLKYIQQTCNKGKIFFINLSLPCPMDYFNYSNYTRPSDLPGYVQNLLNVEHRDDEEIRKLYNMIQSQYAEAGGICEENWLNLYSPLVSMQVDTVDSLFDKRNKPFAHFYYSQQELDRLGSGPLPPGESHPGPMSQDIFANYLLPILKKKLE